MAIKKIVVHAGQAKFADLSVQPNFATGIQNIEGTVRGLSSKENSRAKVDLHGAVDEFSPVAITGEVNVLSAALYTDLGLSFRNMELSTFNPYSGKFAGYNITKGKLTTLLHYKVRDASSMLSITSPSISSSSATKTASKDAVSLPIKLAVALAQGSPRRHRSGYSGDRHARRSEIPARTHHLEGFRQHSRESRHRALCPARLPVRRRT